MKAREERHGQPPPLEPSPLGTKEHPSGRFLISTSDSRRHSWDTTYTAELSNHAADPSDEGTVWFEDSGAEDKILEYISTLAFRGSFGNNGQGCGSTAPSDASKALHGGRSNESRSDLRILDLGTGNGHMLFALHEEEWRAEMLGLDYSEASVQLAERIRQNRMSDTAEGSSVSSTFDGIHFRVHDILHDGPDPSWLRDGFDLVLDKGTFDAISLSSSEGDGGENAWEVYPERAASLLRAGGYLLVTSCNWTEGELRQWFERNDTKLQYFGSIHFPTFSFGGRKGQSVSSVCFRRVEE